MSLDVIFWTMTAFAFALGAVVGSFLNVVIYRVPAGESVVSPPSHCPVCGHHIRWYDNIPIFSWAVLLRGHCRDCNTPISARYALVEGLTGCLTAALWIKIALHYFTNMQAFAKLTPMVVGLPFALYFVFICLLVVITFVDLDHYLIPHRFTIPGMILGVATPFLFDKFMPPGSLYGFWPPVTPWMSVEGLFAGFLSVVGIYFLYLAIRGAEGIGGGDATLMAMMGAWLGWPALIFIFFAASLQGTIAAGVAALVGGDFLKHSSEILGEDGGIGSPPTTDVDQPTPESQETAPDGDQITTNAEETAAEAQETRPDDEDTGEPQDTQDDEVLPVGGLAVPFGPFIALAAVEFFFLGAFFPSIISLNYLYGF